MVSIFYGNSRIIWDENIGSMGIYMVKKLGRSKYQFSFNDKYGKLLLISMEHNGKVECMSAIDAIRSASFKLDHFKRLEIGNDVYLFRIYSTERVLLANSVVFSSDQERNLAIEHFRMEARTSEVGDLVSR